MPRSVIGWLVDWSLRNRFLVACGTLLLVAAGIHAIRNTPVDAIPDLSENQVIVYADWSGRSPQEVEDQVTYPLSTNLQGLAGVQEVRAQSMFGFALLTVVFEDRIDNYFARTRVLERLSFLQDLMPEGVTPQLGPDATGLGWVFQYYLKVDPAKAPNGGYDLGALRSQQDFFIRYQLAAVDGVAEVAEDNTIWVGPLSRFAVAHTFPPADPAAPITTGKGVVGDLLREWQKEGTAAGLHGFLYDNRDADHSNMDYERFPALTRIE